MRKLRFLVLLIAGLLLLGTVIFIVVLMWLSSSCIELKDANGITGCILRNHGQVRTEEGRQLTKYSIVGKVLYSYKKGDDLNLLLVFKRNNIPVLTRINVKNFSSSDKVLKFYKSRGQIVGLPRIGIQGNQFVDYLDLLNENKNLLSNREILVYLNEYRDGGNYFESTNNYMDLYNNNSYFRFVFNNLFRNVIPNVLYVVY